MAQVSCKDRVAKNWEQTKKDWVKAYKKGGEELQQFALSLDYVEPNTFEGQKRGYVRYQFSWGGPSDELRIFKKGRGIDKIEYWFMDWFDGASLNVTNDKVAQVMADYCLDII